MILAPLQKLTNNVSNLGKIIVATSFEWLPKVQKIANLVTLVGPQISGGDVCALKYYSFVSLKVWPKQSFIIL